MGYAPMLWHPVWKLKQAGIEEIAIVTGTEHMGSVVGSLGSGKDFGCRFTYKVQDEACGIAQALATDPATREATPFPDLPRKVYQPGTTEEAREYREYKQ